MCSHTGIHWLFNLPGIVKECWHKVATPVEIVHRFNVSGVHHFRDIFHADELAPNSITDQPDQQIKESYLNRHTYAGWIPQTQTENEERNSKRIEIGNKIIKTNLMKISAKEKESKEFWFIKWLWIILCGFVWKAILIHLVNKGINGYSALNFRIVQMKNVLLLLMALSLFAQIVNQVNILSTVV